MIDEKGGTLQEERQAVALTDEEAAIYDRQIRLWGVESQKRLRKANILIAGLNGLGNEVCKNIMLAGVRHVTLLDSEVLEKDDAAIQFLAPLSHVGKNRAEACQQRTRELNPMVELVVDIDDIMKKSEEFFKKFDVVCLIGHVKETQVKINEICHRNGIKFLSGCVFGHYGFMFQDLVVHRYVEEKIKVEKGSLKGTGEPSLKKAKIETETSDKEEMVEKEMHFQTLDKALAHDIIIGKSLKRIKEVSKAYFVTQVLFEFSEKYKRYPNRVEQVKDWQILLDTRDSVMERLKVDNDILENDFISCCTGELYPVCCVVGGILSQEIIKAVSGKDAPHKNFFFYDGLETSGLVDCLGAS